MEFENLIQEYREFVDDDDYEAIVKAKNFLKEGKYAQAIELLEAVQDDMEKKQRRTVGINLLWLMQHVFLCIDFPEKMRDNDAEWLKKIRECRDEIAYNVATSLNENIARTERNGVQAHLLYDRGAFGFRARVDYVSAVVLKNDDPAGQQSGQIPLVPEWQTTETVFCRPVSGSMIELTHRYVGSSSANSTSAFRLPQVNFFDAKVSSA